MKPNLSQATYVSTVHSSRWCTTPTSWRLGVRCGHAAELTTCCCHSPSVSWTCLGSASLFSLGCPSWLLRMTSVTTHSPEAPPHSKEVGQSCTVTLPHCQGGQRVGACQSHDPKLLWCSSNKTIHRRTSWSGWFSFGRTTFSVI